jgi:hypothetical protein
LHHEDSNGGALYEELVGDEDGEPVARQNFRKKILAEAESLNTHNA